MSKYFLRSQLDWYVKSLNDSSINPEDFISKRKRVLEYLETGWLHRRPLIILLSGPSGMGKSSLALELGYLLGIRSIISTDSLKNAIVGTCENSPSILGYFSHECWKAVDKVYTPENLITGFRKQCDALQPAMNAAINHARRHVQHTIIEGIHLLPSMVEDWIKSDDAIVLPIYILSSKIIFQSQRLEQRYYSTYMHRAPLNYKERLQVFDIFLDWWQQELLQWNCRVIYNNDTADKLIFTCLSDIEKQIP